MNPLCFRWEDDVRAVGSLLSYGRNKAMMEIVLLLPLLGFSGRASVQLGKHLPSEEGFILSPEIYKTA